MSKLTKCQFLAPTNLLALQATAGAPEAPEWVHLLPAPIDGVIETGDARGPYHVADTARIIAASFADDDRLPIDENHATDLAAPRGEPAPARGWITAMEARPDGLWGRVEWNAAGAELIASKSYRGISPVILHDAGKTIHSILRASLVNRPNLRGLTALHQESDMTLLERLAELLGLDATSSEDGVFSALNARLSEDKGGDVPALQSQLAEIGVALGVASDADAPAIIAAARATRTATPAEITALQSEIATLTTSLNALAEGQGREKATAYIDSQIKLGRAGVKPLRDHYISMHMADPARVEKELGALPVLSRSGTLVTPPAPKDGLVSLNAEQSSVARMLGIDPKDYAAQIAAEQANEEAL